MVNSDQIPAIEPAAKKANRDPSLWWKNLGWRKWLLFILFPIPIGPWWQTLIWAVLFGILAWLLIKNAVNRPKLPATPK
jgi:hypothetical protein